MNRNRQQGGPGEDLQGLIDSIFFVSFPDLSSVCAYMRWLKRLTKFQGFFITALHRRKGAQIACSWDWKAHSKVRNLPQKEKQCLSTTTDVDNLCFGSNNRHNPWRYITKSLHLRSSYGATPVQCDEVGGHDTFSTFPSRVSVVCRSCKSIYVLEIATVTISCQCARNFWMPLSFQLQRSALLSLISKWPNDASLAKHKWRPWW